MKNKSDKLHCYEFGAFRLDVNNRELLLDGKHMPLTQKSYDLLCFLIENRDRSLRKNEILNNIWDECFVEEANLAQHIYMIRKVLKTGGGKRTYIETIPKYGYRFVGDVSEKFIDIPKVNTKFVSGSVNSIETNGFQKHKIEIPDPHVRITPSETSYLTDPALVFSFTNRAIWIPIAGLLLAAIIFTGYYLFNSANTEVASPNIRSMAVLPFNEIGNNPDANIGKDIANDLALRLRRQNTISISPEHSIPNLGERKIANSLKLGKELGVDAVLVGSVQSENNNLRVTVQLVSVANKTQIWSDKFDASASNMPSLQNNISEKLAKTLSLKLDLSENAALIEDPVAGA